MYVFVYSYIYGQGIGRGDDSVGNAHRAQISQFELFELKLFNSSCSSSNLSFRVVRAYPLIEIRQTVPCRAIRGNSISVNNTLPPLNQAYILRLLDLLRCLFISVSDSYNYIICYSMSIHYMDSSIVHIYSIIHIV